MDHPARSAPGRQPCGHAGPLPEVQPLRLPDPTGRPGRRLLGLRGPVRPPAGMRAPAAPGPAPATTLDLHGPSGADHHLLSQRAPDHPGQGLSALRGQTLAYILLVLAVVPLAVRAGQQVLARPFALAERVAVPADAYCGRVTDPVDTLDAGVGVARPLLAGLSGVGSSPGDQPVTWDAHRSEDRTSWSMGLTANEDSGETTERQQTEEKHVDPLPDGKGSILLLRCDPGHREKHGGLRGRLRGAGGLTEPFPAGSPGDPSEDRHEQQPLESFPDADHRRILAVHYLSRPWRDVTRALISRWRVLSVMNSSQPASQSGDSAG